MRTPPTYLLACALLLAGCGARRAPGGDQDGHQLTGIASWYGPGFAGRKTASGETYDPRDMTAAHKTLPLGTVVVVTDYTKLGLDEGLDATFRLYGEIYDETLSLSGDHLLHPDFFGIEFLDLEFLDVPDTLPDVSFHRLLSLDSVPSGGVFTATIFTNQPITVHKFKIPKEPQGQASFN